MIRRWLCRLRHPNSKLRPSITGYGGLVCQECGAIYLDLYDAGRLPVYVDALYLERWLKLRLERWETDPINQPEPVVRAPFRVLRRDGGVKREGRVA